MSRYFPNKGNASATIDAYAELIESLERINRYNPPVQTCSTGWQFAGFYKGPTSVSYLFFQLCQIYPDLLFKGQTLLDWAIAYLELSDYQGRSVVDSENCGIANETLAQLALRAVIEHDSSLAQQLCSYENTINYPGSQGSNEWLYGRAGYLYFLRLVRKAFNGDDQRDTHSLLSSTISHTARRIVSSPQPWTWHGKTYIGAAHGWLGILCQVLLSEPSAAQQMEPVLGQLLGVQFRSGNFPSSLPPHSDELIQFCHGSPGFVLTADSIRSYFPSLRTKLDKAIAAARQDVWNRGLLTKEPCLCHGIAGNALALDDREQFEHFLAWMTSESLESHDWMTTAGKKDRFVSLYGGEAGRAWVWAVADQHLPKTCIGFNDL